MQGKGQDDLSTTLLNTYQKALSNFLEEAVILKNKISEAFSHEKDLDSAILGNPLQFTTFNLFDKIKLDQLKFLKDILGNPIRIEKLFRAS